MRMTTEQRAEFIRKFIDTECAPLLTSKGADYNDGIKNPSPNANFGAVAELLNVEGVDRYVVWSVYFLKHLFSLNKWIKGRTVASEPVESRIADMVNYLLILRSMIEEDK
jgi:hypothetical protein